MLRSAAAATSCCLAHVPNAAAARAEIALSAGWNSWVERLADDRRRRRQQPPSSGALLLCRPVSRLASRSSCWPPSWAPLGWSRLATVCAGSALGSWLRCWPPCGFLWQGLVGLAVELPRQLHFGDLLRREVVHAAAGARSESALR